MADRPPALQLNGVCAGYGDTVVLEDVRLVLAAGESVSIIGRNGVGKTTLLATVMGHTNLHGGRLLLHDIDISRMAIHRRVHAGLGYVPQEREIFPSLSVLENLEVAVRPGAWTVRAVFDLFSRLDERKDNRGNQLSGGEQQMLAIGRALTLNPKVLLLDEPTEGLAPIIVEELLAALGTITRAGGICAIIVEQNAQKILGLADRVVILERGTIVHDAASGALKADPAVLERYLGVAGAAVH